MMDTLQKAVYAALHDMGYDPDDEEMAGTPQRWVSFLREFDKNRERDWVFTTFDNPGYDEMIVQSNITFFSLCAHHLVPYYGVAHVGYLPTTRICGLSKLSRLVEYHSRQLATQEKVTIDIANELEEVLAPRGAGVVIEAEHLCMTMRGIKKPGATTTTSALKGVLLDEPDARAEFFSLVNGKGRRH